MPRQGWVDGALVTVLEGEKVLRVEHPHLPPRRIALPRPPGVVTIGPRGTIIATARGKDRDRVVVRRLVDLDHWEEVAEVSSEVISPFGVLVPLGNGDFFLMNGPTPVVCEGKASVFAVLGRGDGKVLRVKRVIDPGYSCPLFKPSAVVGEWEVNSRLQGVIQACLDGFNPLPVGKDMAVVSAFTGHILLFDGGTGDVKQRTGIFPTVKEEGLDVRTTDVDQAVLAALPLPDGDLLLVTRSEEAIQDATKVLVRRKISEVPPEKVEEQLEVERANETSNQRSLDLFPHLEYLVLNAETRRVSLTAPPKGFARTLMSLRALSAFRPSMGVDGVPVLRP